MRGVRRGFAHAPNLRSPRASRSSAAAVANGCAGGANGSFEPVAAPLLQLGAIAI